MQATQPALTIGEHTFRIFVTKSFVNSRGNSRAYFQVVSVNGTTIDNGEGKYPRISELFGATLPFGECSIKLDVSSVGAVRKNPDFGQLVKGQCKIDGKPVVLWWSLPDTAVSLVDVLHGSSHHGAKNNVEARELVTTLEPRSFATATK